MRIRLIIFILMLSPAFIPCKAAALGPRIMGPDMEIINNNIIVSFFIDNVSELEALIKSGIGQEITFTVELLRVWRFWPDEFIVSKRITKSIKYDNLRDYYRVSTFDGVSRSSQNYTDYEALKGRVFSVEHINIAHIKELDPGRYYVRIVVESKSLEQLPLIGFLMHFIPEVEMSLADESRLFRVRGSE